MYHSPCPDELLAVIRQRSNELNPDTRIHKINGMIELFELLSDAGYRTPAILYGFIKPEIERLRH